MAKLYLFKHLSCQKVYMRTLYQTITILFLLTLSGCATHHDQNLPPLPQAPLLTPQTHSSAWWTTRFLLSDKASSPQWELDPMIANEVLAPLLRSFEDDISFWRIHRRAAQDTTGHQLSLHFYATAQTARKLSETIDNEPLLAELWESNLLRKVIHDDPQAGSSSVFSSTSDPNWTKTLQQAWPPFMMGASITWLSLVQQRAHEFGAHKAHNVDELQEIYKQVERKVALSWSRQGQHAFLHHLSGLFGYHPLNLKKEIIF